MPAHIILHPRQRSWLTHIIPRDDHVDGEVLHADFDASLVEQDPEADGEDTDAEDAEAVAVAELVSREGDDDAED